MTIKSAAFLAAFVAALTTTNAIAPDSALPESTAQSVSSDAAILRIAGDATALTAFEGDPSARRRRAAQAGAFVLQLSALVHDQASATVLRMLADALHDYRPQQVEEASRLRLLAERRLSR
jgi:hypothetical protein